MADVVIYTKSYCPYSKETKDFYSELIKLDDLRERGIITDEEFDARKKKILNEN